MKGNLVSLVWIPFSVAIVVFNISKFVEGSKLTEKVIYI
jgi:hypothetical protein